MNNLIQSKNQYFEKILRDKNGRLVRATFQVYENAGRVKAKLVSFVYITAGELSGSVSAILGLTKKAAESFVQKISFYNTDSFTFSLNNIFSLGSKPRAPTI